MARSRSDAPFSPSVLICAPVVVRIFIFGFAEMTWRLVTTAGPSAVLTRKPVPSALSPLISTTAWVCASVRLIGAARSAGAGVGGVVLPKALVSVWGVGGVDEASCSFEVLLPKQTLTSLRAWVISSFALDVSLFCKSEMADL